MRVALATNGFESNTGIGTGGIPRFGMDAAEIAACVRDARSAGIEAFGLQMYAGTCIYESRVLLAAIDRVLEIAATIENLRYIDIGGGFGIPYADSQRPFRWAEFGRAVTKRMTAASRKRPRLIELKLEPGRSIIGSAGLLLTRVIDIKRHQGVTFVGVDTSVGNFARTYIYGQAHRIILANRPNARLELRNVAVTGNSIAHNDLFAVDLKFPRVNVGDLLAILDAGAYGYSMSSQFCGRVRPAEVLMKDGGCKLIRERESEKALLWAHQPARM